MMHRAEHTRQVVHAHTNICNRKQDMCFFYSQCERERDSRSEKQKRLCESMPARRVHAQRPSIHAHRVATFVNCNVTREYIGRQYTSTKYVNHRMHANFNGVTPKWERRRHNINNIQRSCIFICNCTLLIRNQCRLIALQLMLALRPDGVSCTHTHTHPK